MRNRIGFFVLPSVAVCAVLFVSACTGIPKGLEPVTTFDLQRYLGTWHEIARLDHKFEQGLSEVTAEYSLREDGGVRVLNRGLSEKTGEIETAEGKAYFVGDSNTGHLKVSFFGPFYGSYVVLVLEPLESDTGVPYSYSLVAGPNRKYLWLLSREPTMAPELFDRLTSFARDKGFPVGDLIILDDAQLP